MYIPKLRRARKWYTQLEVSTQIGDISNLMEQRKEATKSERVELDTQIEIAQYVLTHMVSRNQRKIKRELR